MALSREDKADVSRSFGKKAASAVSKATKDSHRNPFSGAGADGAAAFGRAMSANTNAKSRALDAKVGKKGVEKVLGQSTRVGSKRHANLTAQKKHFDSFDSREL